MSAIEVGSVHHVHVPSLPCRIVRVKSSKGQMVRVQPWSDRLGRWAKGSTSTYHRDFLGASADNDHAREVHGYYPTSDAAKP